MDTIRPKTEDLASRVEALTRPAHSLSIWGKLAVGLISKRSLHKCAVRMSEGLQQAISTLGAGVADLSEEAVGKSN